MTVTQGTRVGVLAAFTWILLSGCESRSEIAVRSMVPPAAPDQVELTLFLVGDAGAPARGGEPVLSALYAEARAASNPVIAFLGDNVYPRGLPDSAHPTRHEAERRLMAQILAVRASGARGFFVPGNHDWDSHSADGWEAVRRQGRFVSAQGDHRVQLLPENGCPGPSVVDLGQSVRLVLLDTQWWLHGGTKPRHPVSPCPADSEAEILDALRVALRPSDSRRVIVMGHHPIQSGGPHGGHFGWRDHVFPLRRLHEVLWVPLPGLGSLYPLARVLGVSNQDVSSGAYGRMATALERVFAETPPLVYATGHDHGLQAIGGRGPRYLLVSGAGVFGHHERMAWTDRTLFAAAVSGYMRVEFLRDGLTRLGVWVADWSGHAFEAFSLWLD